MTAKTRPYYVELGKADAKAGKPMAEFSKTSWQSLSYTEGYKDQRRAMEEAPTVAQEPANPVSEAMVQNPYVSRLLVELDKFRAKYGFVYDGGEDGPRWHTDRLLRPQVYKRLAKLEGLIQTATRGKPECREVRVNAAQFSGRSYRPSIAWIRKEGAYRPGAMGGN